jgi:hypothetical protein
MLRRISTVAAAAAMLGLCALPAAASTTAAHASTHNFTVPSASSAVKGWGSYDKLNSVRVKVMVCSQKKSGTWVGAEAIGYNSKNKEVSAIAGVVGPQTPGQKSCGTAYMLNVAHLKVYTFIGSNGRIVKKSSTKKIY